MDGFLNLLKPPGMTSSDLVILVRRTLPRGTKVGHGGTLDPDAAGVLPICVGRATRLFDYLIDKRKEYLAELCLGIATDTQDATGRVIGHAPIDFSDPEAAIRACLPAFTGDILQTPPAFSALKRGGRPLYELARSGRIDEAALEPRPVTIHELTYEFEVAPDRHMLRIVCGKGVYIRTLCNDLGARLGCLGHMSFLLRTKAGAFEIENACTPEEFLEQGAQALLQPMDLPLRHLPRATVRPEYLDRALCGNPLSPAWYESDGPLADGAVRLYAEETLLGIGAMRTDGEIRVKTMLAVKDS